MIAKEVAKELNLDWKLIYKVEMQFWESVKKTAIEMDLMNADFSDIRNMMDINIPEIGRFRPDIRIAGYYRNGHFKKNREKKRKNA